MGGMMQKQLSDPERRVEEKTLSRIKKKISLNVPYYHIGLHGVMAIHMSNRISNKSLIIALIGSSPPSLWERSCRLVWSLSAGID